MAPEVRDEKQYNGEKADLFSAGVILFTFYTARNPFSIEPSIKDPFY